MIGVLSFMFFAGVFGYGVYRVLENPTIENLVAGIIMMVASFLCIAAAILRGGDRC